ncbi:hypothetical protein MAR_038178, partial [Mya arenaria]
GATIPPSSDNLPNYDELSTGWSSDPALLPKLALSDIEKYLIHSSHRTSDSMKMECYRQYIRGLIFYKEKYVHKVMINTLSESSSHCYVKSKCHPSMKQGFHTQWVLMTKGTHLLIMKANCTCPAGSKLADRLGNKSNAVLFDLISPTENDVPVETDLKIADEVKVETSEFITYRSDKYIDLSKTINENQIFASDFLETLSVCGGDVVEEIEMRTRGQHKNPLLDKARKDKITASIFHDVLHRKKST